MSLTIQVKRGLENNIPALNQGEFGYAIDSKKLYIGNGVESSNTLISASDTDAPLVCPSQGFSIVPTTLIYDVAFSGIKTESVPLIIKSPTPNLNNADIKLNASGNMVLGDNSGYEYVYMIQFEIEPNQSKAVTDTSPLMMGFKMKATGLSSTDTNINSSYGPSVTMSILSVPLTIKTTPTTSSNNPYVYSPLNTKFYTPYIYGETEAPLSMLIDTTPWTQKTNEVKRNIIFSGFSSSSTGSIVGSPAEIYITRVAARKHTS